ncbi:MAG: hypothetical protein HRU15_19770 [Planctomycetes bacterium]|nr:hypothetical protein [Planctomycetota bacterium]
MVDIKFVNNTVGTIIVQLDPACCGVGYLDVADLSKIESGESGKLLMVTYVDSRNEINVTITGKWWFRESPASQNMFSEKIKLVREASLVAKPSFREWKKSEISQDRAVVIGCGENILITKISCPEGFSCQIGDGYETFPIIGNALVIKFNIGDLKNIKRERLVYYAYIYYRKNNEVDIKSIPVSLTYYNY